MSTHGTRAPHERAENLWLLVISPSIWGAHFLLSYCTAAVWCAKLPESPDGVRLAIAAYTLAALAGIALAGRHAWRRHRFGGAESPHDFDSSADRHRFLGFAAFLLAGLSAIAVLFAAYAALATGSCR